MATPGEQKGGPAALETDRTAGPGETGPRGSASAKNPRTHVTTRSPAGRSSGGTSGCGQRSPPHSPHPGPGRHVPGDATANPLPWGQGPSTWCGHRRQRAGLHQEGSGQGGEQNAVPALAISLWRPPPCPAPDRSTLVDPTVVRHGPGCVPPPSPTCPVQGPQRQGGSRCWPPGLAPQPLTVATSRQPGRKPRRATLLGDAQQGGQVWVAGAGGAQGLRTESRPGPGGSQGRAGVREPRAPGMGSAVGDRTPGPTSPLALAGVRQRALPWTDTRAPPAAGLSARSGDSV